MSDRTEDGTNPVTRQAAEWYWAIREPDVADAALAEWEEWLAQSSEHRVAFERVEGILDAAGMVDDPPWPTEAELLEDGYDGSVTVAAWREAEGNRRREKNRNHPAEPQRTRPSVGWAVAASVALVAVATMVYVADSGSPAYAPAVVAYHTAPAEHRDVMLPDGSSISLGARTSVAVNYGPDVRRIELSRGEAYFSVAEMPYRPFEVVAKGRRMVAVGTAFNVTYQADRVTLTVTEGTVVVEAGPVARAGSLTDGGKVTGTGSQFARVQAGQRIVYDDDLEPVSAVDTEDALAWRRGMLKYRGEPLRYVIEDVNRYTRQPIRIADGTAAGLSFTGTVFQDSAESWVYGLEDAFPVTVTRTPDGVSIRSR